MTDRSRLARHQARWVSWFAALVLFFALFPASAGQCARGTRACPMATAGGRCACCCAHPGSGGGLTQAPCPTPQALPAPPALPTLKQSLVHRGASASHAASPSCSVSLPATAMVTRSTASSDDSPPPAPPHSQASLRAPPARSSH